MTIGWYIIYLLLFGFLLTAAGGLFVSWVDRKLTARVQYRVGPPLRQPLFDIIKLMGKELILPARASPAVFIIAPVVGLGSVALTATLLWGNIFDIDGLAFLGDLVVVLYLLVIPSLSIIMGGFASGNPLATLGASREMKLVLAYELPFIIAILIPVIQAGYSIRIGDIILHQARNGAAAGSVSGLLGLAVALLAVQAKLALVPFDIPEAETEIMGGPFIEYSGPGLAGFRLMKNMLLFVLPAFLVIIFLGGGRGGSFHWVWDPLKLLALLAVITVIRNTNPRLRIDQALRFFWGPVTGIAVIAVLLALKGW